VASAAFKTADPSFIDPYHSRCSERGWQNFAISGLKRSWLEYAVVHELCPLRHRNHDGSFWGLVGSILPDWQARKTWLDHNEHFLKLRHVEPTG
jgi:hypothetical protein